MSDEAALLTAIAAHPDEDTPRLMYADWLDENGRPIRAEFIRVQIDIARKDHLPRAILNRYVDLFKRNQDLIDDHRTELLGPLAGLPAEVRVEFRRGFVSEVTLSAFHYYQHMHSIAALELPPRVAVEDSVGVIRGFLGFDVYIFSPDSSMHLVVAVRTGPNGDETADWVVDRGNSIVSPLTWPRLETLDVSGCRLGDRNATGLLRDSAFPTLFDLDLSENDLTDTAVESLLGSDLPRQLKRLILGGNDISDAGAVALAERWPTAAADRLEHLNLRFTNIGPVGQAALLRRFGGRVDLF